MTRICQNALSNMIGFHPSTHDQCFPMPSEQTSILIDESRPLIKKTISERGWTKELFNDQQFRHFIQVFMEHGFYKEKLCSSRLIYESGSHYVNFNFESLSFSLSLKKSSCLYKIHTSTLITNGEDTFYGFLALCLFIFFMFSLFLTFISFSPHF